MSKCPFSSVEEYIDSFEEPIHTQLHCLRRIIRDTLPDATEKLAWGAPAYYIGKYLLQFAGNKSTIGFYTSPETITHFQGALAGYKTNTKNTVLFPMDQPLPEETIRAMILYRVAQVRG